MPHVERADFTDPRLKEFLQAHLDDMAPTAPAESRHALDLAGLQDPSVRLWVVRDGGEIIGTGALAALEPGHEELKSMRTAPARRGQGIARLLLDHLIRDAGGAGCRAHLPGNRQHGLLRGGPRPLRQGGFHAVPAVRCLRGRPQQHLHDAHRLSRRGATATTISASPLVCAPAATTSGT
ncbi:GNAT family N-acetyltransferase [Saccharothrix syringae]|uniref:GNAT family N-acetyltransferase n=1 Tax=Saccharothrix syringae TaxID=103733 RepID=UPI001D172412|nr:GNAT family N-acetyltransferase [Saccharothrix syringae]